MEVEARMNRQRTSPSLLPSNTPVGMGMNNCVGLPINSQSRPVPKNPVPVPKRSGLATVMEQAKLEQTGG